jgi:hypothetical protein
MSWGIWSGQSGGSGGGGGTWGSITGTLSSQTDLQTALDAKVGDTGDETIAGAKTFSGIMALTAGVASTNTTTGSLVVTGGIGASGALNTAGTVRHTNTTDSTSISSGSVVLSGGLGITKTLHVGTGVTVATGNVLVTSGNIGRDTGVSGSLTDCPTNVFCNYLYVKTGWGYVANSATAGLAGAINSATSVCLIKSGSTEYVTCTTTQNNIRVRMHYGAGENNIFDFSSTILSTTNATPTTLWSFSTVSRNNWVFKVDIFVVCRRSDSGTEYGQFAKSFVFSRESDVNTLRSTVDIHADTLTTLTTATIQGAVSGDNIIVQAVGEAAKTLRWGYRVDYTMLST